MLKDVLRAKGIKQTYLAERIGVSVVTVSNWVQGKTAPNKKHLDKLCDVLDVEEKDIVN